MNYINKNNFDEAKKILIKQKKINDYILQDNNFIHVSLSLYYICYSRPIFDFFLINQTRRLIAKFLHAADELLYLPLGMNDWVFG